MSTVTEKNSTVTISYTPEEILKRNFIILTGVSAKGEWKRACIKGDVPPEKRKGFNSAFSYDLIALLEQAGCQEFSTVK